MVWHDAPSISVTDQRILKIAMAHSDNQQISSNIPVNYIVPFHDDYQIKKLNARLVHSITTINRSLTTVISENNTCLNTLPRPIPTINDTISLEKSSQNQENRKRIENLLQTLNEMKSQRENLEDIFELMPLWRHRLLHPDIPLEDIPPEKILSGIRLFRVIVHGIRLMYCEPLLRVRKRKLSCKLKEISDWQRTLTVFIDACSSWMGKLVKVPIQSIEQARSSSMFALYEV